MARQLPQAGRRRPHGTLDGFGGKGSAAGVDGGAADQVLLEREAMAEPVGHGAEHPDGFGDDLRADTVAGQGHEMRVHESAGYPLGSGTR